jgi:hypothetical protein
MASIDLEGDSAYRPRQYQVEMFEASRRGNIIVAVCLFTQAVMTMKN